MSGLHTNWTSPPRNAPSFDILTTPEDTTRTARWTGRSCNLVPGGKVFLQHDPRDRGLYTQAGCTHTGTQGFRPSLFLSVGHTTPPTYETVLLNTWCCQPNQVVDVFNAYVQSDEYRRSQKMIFVYVGLAVLAVAILIKNRKKLGFKPRLVHGDFIRPNPYDEDDWGTEERDDG